MPELVSALIAALGCAAMGVFLKQTNNKERTTKNM
jgi:hypothetical protein